MAAGGNLLLLIIIVITTCVWAVVVEDAGEWKLWKEVAIRTIS